MNLLFTKNEVFECNLIDIRLNYCEMIEKVNPVGMFITFVAAGIATYLHHFTLCYVFIGLVILIFIAKIRNDNEKRNLLIRLTDIQHAAAKRYQEHLKARLRATNDLISTIGTYDESNYPPRRT